MPMQARFEDGANYRWLNKPVAESRLLDSMENLSNWRFGGAGEVSLTEARAKDGSRSLRMRKERLPSLARASVRLTSPAPPNLQFDRFSMLSNRRDSATGLFSQR